MNKTKSVINVGEIQQRILIVRGEKAIIEHASAKMRADGRGPNEGGQEEKENGQQPRAPKSRYANYKGGNDATSMA